ncbi:MAG: nucleoside triphosphate pyrophosphohydrolase [Bacteriovoracaceae bacterium]|nr:nucleoside triphosphate pyrophosphohydrolase [Bacteroidota bacterium]
MKEFDEFVSIMKHLRTECPWDKEQTHESLKKHFVEEAYEALDAVDRKNFNDLRGELGDVALQVVFHAIIAEEEQQFTLEEVFTEINQKLIRRHPHIYGTAVVNNGAEQSALWDKIKMTEGRMSVLEGIPMNLPALMKAEKVQKKAAKVGFEWKQRKDVWKKVEEEMAELHEAVASNDKKHTHEEFGDLLFSLVNYARFIDVDPEESLQATVLKFTHRFQYIEKKLIEQGKDIHVTSLEEMDQLWNKAKTEVQ